MRPFFSFWAHVVEFWISVSVLSLFSHKMFALGYVLLFLFSVSLSLPLVQPPAGSFVYSGRHDHGILLPPRRRGGGANQSDTMARLIAAVQQAKERSNGYLTRIIQHEKKATPSPSINMEPSTKRTKVEKDE